MRSIAWAAAALLVAVSTAGPGFAGTVVAGSEESTLLLPKGMHVEPYANNGYRLTVDGDSIRVVVDAAPLGSSAPMPRSPALRAQTGVDRVARGVSAGVTSQVEAVSRVLSWVARHIRYDRDRSRPQDPEAVLARRTAYCTGLARLTVAMLEGLGIEAREVPGYVIADGGTGGEFHRWVEVRYPDRGWVFSDPLRSHHFVPSSYLRLASAEADREASANALLLARGTALREVDVLESLPAGIRVRSNDGRQRMAALRVDVSPAAASGRLVLTGRGLRREQALDSSGSAAFFGLDLGEYRLEWIAAGRFVASKQLSFLGPVRAEVHLVDGDAAASQRAGVR